jgi:hypothetical protein
MYEEGKIGIVGGIYSVETGGVNFIRKMFIEKQPQGKAVLQ